MAICISIAISIYSICVCVYVWCGVRVSGCACLCVCFYFAFQAVNGARAGGAPDGVFEFDTARGEKHAEQWLPGLTQDRARGQTLNPPD